MSQAALSPKLQKMIAREMEVGDYSSQEQLLTQALRALAERRSAIAGIQRGLDDAAEGRTRSRKAFSRGVRRRHPFLANR